MSATERRRAVLEGVAFGPESGEQARLRALELLERLDERESAERPAPTADELTERFAEELADDAERLTRVAALYLETGLLAPIIEERARALAAEMTRERFAAVGGAESAADATATDEPSEAQETASEPENERRTHPADEAAFRLMADDEPPPPSMLTRLRKSS